MKIVTYLNAEHGACVLVRYDNGSLAPVRFLASTAEKAEIDAATWYEGEVARFAKLKTPPARKPGAAKAPAPIACDACDMMGEPCRLHA